MIRIIPGKIKVQIELFKGVTLADMLVGLLCAIILVFIIVSSLPFKFAFVIVHLLISAILLFRIDSEPNYMFFLNILRHLGYKRKYERMYTDNELFDMNEKEEVVAVLDELGKEDEKEIEITETKEERKLRLKREKAEFKKDTKLLKSHKLTKEEEDAIWLKRANQSKRRKEEKASLKEESASREVMEDIIAFTDIEDKYISYGGKYYGAVLEIPPIEFRFFSQHRRNNSIERCLGSVLRSVKQELSINIVKIERPINYDNYIERENDKLDELRNAFEQGFITEDELKARVEIVYDRIKELMSLESDSKVIAAYYYICLFNGDKNQLDLQVRNAMSSLQNGEMNPRRLAGKDLAVFLKYTNELDFDENEIDKVDPKDYAKWAMPKTVDVKRRTVQVNDMTTHNMRMVSFPVTVNDAWLASLMSFPSTKVIIKATPVDRGKSIRSIDRSLSELRAKYASARTDSEALDAQNHIETLQVLLQMLQNDNEAIMNVNVYVTSYDALKSLEDPNLKSFDYKTHRPQVVDMKRTVRRLYQEQGFRLNNMEFNQMTAFIGSQVSGYDPLSKDGRGMPTNTIAAIFPWVYSYIMDENGIKLGSSDGIPIFMDFFRRDEDRVNSNMVIVGKSGSGKSFATKSLLSNFAAEDSKIFILDPENEYTELAKNLNGKFINVGNASQGRLNPFHIITELDDDEEGNGDGSSYSTHLQFLEEFFKQILPDCDSDALEYLNNLVDRMYQNKGIDQSTDLSRLRPEDYPIFDDLYDEILKEFQRTDNEYIKTMLRTLMNYVSKFSTGGRNANIWNGPSTVTTDENFTVFNFQSMLANRNGLIANAQMLLVLKYIDNEIIKNRDYNLRYGLNRKIIVVIDEAHVFIDTKYPIALDFMFQLAKRIRKYNGMQIVITQNIKDFVGSEEIARKSTAIINACQYSFIFSLAPNDMQDLCTLYEKAGGINEQEQEEIIQAPRGQAFAVLGPTSRTTFSIDVPANVIDLFSNPDFTNRYFTGNGGEENWQNFIKDSIEKRTANLEERLSKKEEYITEKAQSKKHVMLEEISEEEYNVLTEDNKVQETKANVKPVFNLEDFEIPEIPDTPEEFKSETARPIEKPVEIIREVQAESSKTTEILSELLDKLSMEQMREEIKRAVKDELSTIELPSEPYKENTSVNINEEEKETKEDDSYEPSGLFDGLFDDGDYEEDNILDEEESLLSLLSDNTEKSEESENEETSQALGNIFDMAQEESHFDIMDFIREEADKLEEVSPIDEMITYDELVTEISLEQLIKYNERD